MQSKTSEITTNFRQSPSNVSAEQAVLGEILTNNDSLFKVSDFLRPEHFFEPIHQKIFENIMALTDKGLLASPITLKNKFEKEDALKDFGGGGEYLAKLAMIASSIINIVEYSKLIVDLYLKRNLINIGEEIVIDAYDPKTSLSAIEQIEEAEQKLFNLDTLGQEGKGSFIPIRASLAQALNKAQHAFKNKEKVTGVSTNFIDLDNLLGGLQNSDLIILAGRPSMGKTSLAINIALNACKFLAKNKIDDQMKSVGFFSLEMSSEQLATRMLAMESDINSSMLLRGSLDESDFPRLVKANKDLYDLPFYIDDTASLTISALRTRARRLKRKNNLGLIVVDYLQLLRGSGKYSDNNRVLEISDITQGLKAIAKELNIPVIALSQLSRAVEQREDKKPLLSDLRESGSIEQDADIVMFIYREEYYLIRKEPKHGTPEWEKWQTQVNEIANLAEVIIAKQRNGPIGNVKLFFDSNTTKFSNYTKINY